MSDKLAEARAAIKAEKKRVADECWADIQAVLKKHGCELYGTPELVPTAPGVFGTAVKLWVSARED